MRNKIIVTVALLVMLLHFSSCYMRQPGMGRNYYRPTHTYRHYGREGHLNVRHMYWGHHKSGMRPNRHRGGFRD